jgi:hypothetical protein
MGEAQVSCITLYSERTGETTIAFRTNKNDTIYASPYAIAKDWELDPSLVAGMNPGQVFTASVLRLVEQGGLVYY